MSICIKLHITGFFLQCFKHALHSRNEDLLRVLLDHLEITKQNFNLINSTFLDPLLLEAVELDDLESLQGRIS